MANSPFAPNTTDTNVFTRTFSQEDFNRFGILSGDDNPIHVSPEFSARTRFGRTVSHGMLLYTAIDALLSRQFPNLRPLKQELMFPNPTFAGEEITFTVFPPDTSNDVCSIAVVLTKKDGTCVCESQTELVSAATLRATTENTTREIQSSNGEDTETYKHLAVGQRASVQRIFTASDVAEYMRLAGLPNESDAQHIAPPLPAGMISALLGMTLPGKGTNYLKQRYTLFDTARVGEEITASVEIVRIRGGKALVNLRTLCRVGDRIIADGEALVLAKDVEVSTNQ
jgi:acyl dehydratase